MLDLRIKQKKDTESNWISFDPVILDGEVILVVTSDRVRVKVGDGSSKYSELPFLDSDIYTKVSEKADKNSLAAVATTGSYTDLIDTPTIQEYKFIRDRVIIEEDETVSVDIPSSLSSQDDDNLSVYQNGLLLEKDIHYSRETTTISLIDSSAKSGDIFSFVALSTIT